MGPQAELPYEIKNVTREEDKLIKKCIVAQTRTFIKCGKGQYVMPGAFRKAARDIYNMEVRPDDIWVITFPRSGTTWTQELVWLLENNLDFKGANDKPLYERFPMLETTTMIPDIGFELIKANFLNLGNFQGLRSAVKYPSWKSIDEAPSPRLIKTHLPLSLLPPNLLEKAKVLYVARDPRDVAVSYYFLLKMVSKGLMRGNMRHYWDAMRRDLLPWTPIVSHTNEAWEKRFHPNLHFTFYEDMLQDLPREIRKICEFLNKDYNDKEITMLADHLSFNNLRKSKAVNNTVSNEKDGVQFIRKGESGDWKSHFDEEMEQQAEEFLISRLRGLDLTYPTFSMGETTHL